MHVQLAHRITVPFPNHVLLATQSGFSSLNLTTNQSKKLIECESYSIAFDKRNELLTGLDADKHFFVHDLKSGKQVLRMQLGDADMVNNAQFVDYPQQSVFVCANSTDVTSVDIEKQALVKCMQSSDNVNFLAFSDRQNLFALATDDTVIEVMDPRAQKTTVCPLHGHEDANFAVEFLDDFVLASGGQDSSLRLWDLRKPNSETDLLVGNGMAVSSIKWDARRRVVYSIDYAVSVNAFSQDRGEWRRSAFSFFGITKGLDLVPGSGQVVVGIAERNYGGLLSLQLR